MTRETESRWCRSKLQSEQGQNGLEYGSTGAGRDHGEWYGGSGGGVTTAKETYTSSDKEVVEVTN